MNGSLESKLQDECFVNSLIGFDIIALSECWINGNSKIDLNGYVPVSKPRRRRKNARRDSGGLVCYFKENIWEGVRECYWDFEDGLAFKLDKTFFSFNDDIFMIVPYMRPSTSTRNVLENGVDAFEILTDKIAELCIHGQICVLGDMNARTGCLQDLNEVYDFDEFDDAIENARQILPNDLLDCGMSVHRALPRIFQWGEHQAM